MNLSASNYYGKLGLLPSASVDDIRRAYRNMARIYHPDVAINKTMAEEMFKQLNEAYSTLVDADLRQTYDLELKEARTRRAAAPTGRHRPTSGETDTPPPKFRRKKPAPTEAPAPKPRHRPDLDIESALEVDIADAIHGATYVLSIDQNDASSRRRELHSCRVDIPAGVYEEQRLRLRGLGYTDRYQNEAGDLYLTIRYARHKEFRHLRGSLFSDLVLTPWEAALGGRVRVPTLDGMADLNVPPGTQPAQRLILRGHQPRRVPRVLRRSLPRRPA